MLRGTWRLLGGNIHVGNSNVMLRNVEDYLANIHTLTVAVLDSLIGKTG